MQEVFDKFTIQHLFNKFPTPINPEGLLAFTNAYH
jgi:hypothetical protein